MLYHYQNLVMDFDQARWSPIKINTIETGRARVEPLIKPECSEFNLVMIEQIEISSFGYKE
jgi:hypothetical protein